MTQKQRAKAEESQQKLKAEQDKNKVLLQQLADRFKVERQAFIDAMVMTGVSRQDAEKRFLDYVNNKGRGYYKSPQPFGQGAVLRVHE